MTLNWTLGKKNEVAVWDPSRSPDCSASPVPRLGASWGHPALPKQLWHTGTARSPARGGAWPQSADSPRFPLKSLVQQFPPMGQTFAPEWADSGLNVAI